MKYAIAIAIYLMVASALAAEKKTISLSPSEANTIASGLMMLDGHHHVIKDARGQEVDAPEPFNMEGGLALALGHDLTLLRAYLVDAQTASKSHPDQIDAIMATKLPIDLMVFDKKDLRADVKLPDGSPVNPYPQSALSYIEPLFSDYAAPTPHTFPIRAAEPEAKKEPAK